ncbi:MAG: alpha/beta hydrolase [Hyphomicrobium sp.]
MPNFDSAGVDIAYFDTGEAHGEDPFKTPILLIHGFASNIATNWISTGWVETLKRAGYRVIAIDNRGHGMSAKLYEQADYSAPVMAEDARHLLDHLSIPQAHVMGFSMGARISAFLTLAHPARVKSVVFGGLGLNMIRGLAGTGPIARALEAGTIDDVTNPAARTFRAFAEQTRSDLKALAACIRAARSPISEDMVALIAAPVLVVVGSDDVVGGPAEDLAALIPGARAVTLAGRDHMKSVGDKTYKEEVLRFLAQVEADTA